MATTFWHSVSNSNGTTYLNYRKPTSNSSFGSKVTSNNIENGGYPIVDAFQVAGHHVVGTESQLYCIPLSILSPNYGNSIGVDEGETTADLSGQDALGQIWYVNRSKKYYRLDKFPTHAADFSKNTDLTYNSTYAGSVWTEISIIPASEYSNSKYWTTNSQGNSLVLDTSKLNNQDDGLVVIDNGLGTWPNAGSLITGISNYTYGIRTSIISGESIQAYNLNGAIIAGTRSYIYNSGSWRISSLNLGSFIQSYNSTFSAQGASHTMQNSSNVFVQGLYTYTANVENGIIQGNGLSWTCYGYFYFVRSENNTYDLVYAPLDSVYFRYPGGEDDLLQKSAIMPYMFSHGEFYYSDDQKTWSTRLPDGSSNYTHYGANPMSSYIDSKNNIWIKLIDSNNNSAQYRQGYCFAIGNSVTNIGQNIINSGPGNYIHNSNNAAVIGEGLAQLDASNCLTIGQWNSLKVNNPAFVVGNGNQETRSNALTLDKEGNLWVAKNIKIGLENETFIKKSPLPGNEIEYIWAGTQDNYNALGDVSSYTTTLFIIKE